MNTINPPYLFSISHHPSPNILVAHIENGRILFMQEMLKDIMQKYGINIPPSERENYEGRSIVYLQDDDNKLFEKAFRAIYYPLHMPKDEYQWSHTTPPSSG